MSKFTGGNKWMDIRESIKTLFGFCGIALSLLNFPLEQKRIYFNLISVLSDRNSNHYCLMFVNILNYSDHIFLKKSLKSMYVAQLSLVVQGDNNQYTLFTWNRCIMNYSNHLISSMNFLSKKRKMNLRKPFIIRSKNSIRMFIKAINTTDKLGLALSQTSVLST